MISSVLLIELTPHFPLEIAHLLRPYVSTTTK